MTKERCVELIRIIYGSCEDVVLPAREEEQPITLLASKEGYQMQAAYEPKEYDSAENVFKALFAYAKEIEDDPMWSLLKDLEHVI